MSNAIFHYDLTPTEFMVYNYLVSCAGQKGVCWPSIGKIALNCNCSENTARKAVTSLVRKKFIRKVTTYEDWGDHSRQTNKQGCILISRSYTILYFSMHLIISFAYAYKQAPTET